jgi:hypothetical protein
MPGDVVGRLADVGLNPLLGRFPRLTLRLDQPTTFGTRLLVTDKFEATINDATGEFVFQNVVGSDEMLPAGTYTLTADWDAGRELDVLSGLRVPSTGGTVSDMIAAMGQAQPGTVMYGFGPPPATLSNVLYADISGAKPVLYAPSNGGT